MWCCVGSGMENHGKYNELIYTHSGDSLFINLFVAFALNWKEKGLQIKQETAFPYEEKTKLIITKGTSLLSLLVRYPGWVADGVLRISVNDKPIAITSHPSSYIVIKRQWEKGDVVEVTLPMHNKVEHLPNVPSYIAILHGPILLNARTGTEDLKGLMADDSRWGHIASGEKLPLDKAPILIEDNLATLANDLVPVPDQPLHYRFKSVKMVNPADITLQPFYTLHNARYMIYWMALSNDQYTSYLDSIAKEEKEKIALEKCTLDCKSSAKSGLKE